MKLWLLDADIIIDFLSHDVLDKLIKHHEIHAATSVIDEVRYFKRGGKKYSIAFREKYIQTDLIKECSATDEDAANLFNRLPPNLPFTIHAGEIESLAILIKNTNLVFCTCDAASIRTLPFLDAVERGISAEQLLKQSGLLKPGLKDRHTEEYFKNNIAVGQEQKMYKTKS